jgi:hypothetical protein
MLLSGEIFINMIGKDQPEEVSFKVADRRKFNADGTLKEGVTLDAEPRTDEPRRDATAQPAETSRPPTAGGDETPDNASADPYDDVPGADDPASFVNFLSTLATNAAASLGAVPHPATGKRSIDLDTGKYWLDVLGMLREKTLGNLHSQESRLLDGLLADLRMQYVQLVRATEEKLKAQAAKKFSASDILGKK